MCIRDRGDQFGKRRTEVFGVLQAAIQLLRDEMIAAAQATSEAGKNETQSVGVASRAAVFSRAISATLQCLSDLNSNLRPRMALEAMVVAWPNSEPRDR